MTDTNQPEPIDWLDVDQAGEALCAHFAINVVKLLDNNSMLAADWATGQVVLVVRPEGVDALTPTAVPPPLGFN